MSAPRFFVECELAPGTDVELPAAVAHHAQRVLRLREGDALVLFNSRGGEFTATLLGTARARIGGHDMVERESPIAVTLVQAWIASDKLDWLLEKAVELGLARLILCPTRRAVVTLDGERRERRLARLREIAIAACAQCGRNRVPEVIAGTTLRDGLERAPAASGARLLLDPLADTALVHAAAPHSELALAIGPEGGFAPEEIALATQLGYRQTRLGPRILRTETAGVAALAALQAAAGDFRGA